MGKLQCCHGNGISKYPQEMSSQYFQKQQKEKTMKAGQCLIKHDLKIKTEKGGKHFIVTISTLLRF